MNVTKSTLVEHFQEAARFDELKTKLLTKPFADHLKKPLAYWAVPSDRRLPLAFLGRMLGVILRTPFQELASTPGVGPKKIVSLVQLLSRAAATDPTDLPKICEKPFDLTAFPYEPPPKPHAFSPANVSEVVWEQWRASVVEHGLENEILGRFAPRLRDVTRMIWTKRLGDYTGHTLAELRKLKTHGEKRIRSILEVFHALHTIVATMGTQKHLVLRIVPARIDRVEHWISDTLGSREPPDKKSLLENFLVPLVEQIHDDANDQVAGLTDWRLGIGRPATSVRQISREMGLTRARVYQLLTEIHEIMRVRWPTGRRQVNELRRRFSRYARQLKWPVDLRQFETAAEIFYPTTRRDASESANPMSGEDDAEDGAESNNFRPRATEVSSSGKSPVLAL